jgi:hypothetical protein
MMAWLCRMLPLVRDRHHRVEFQRLVRSFIVHNPGDAPFTDAPRVAGQGAHVTPPGVAVQKSASFLPLSPRCGLLKPKPH